MTEPRHVAGARTLDSLIVALENLTEQSAALTADVHSDAEQRRVEDVRRRKATQAVLAVGALLVVLVVAVLAIGWQNSRITRQNNELNRQVRDCTTIGGQCYEQGAKRTGAAIDELVRANAALHRCLETPGVDTDAELMACVRAAAPPR